MAEPRITTGLAERLIAEQFAQWSGETVRPVATSGWDNRSFHLGDDKIIRMPSAARYAGQPNKEWTWLPHLAAHLPVPISEVVGRGQPSADYPYCWTVLSYVPGVPLGGEDRGSVRLAEDLAQFLNALRTVPTEDAPRAGQHNFYRGGDLRIYDQDLRRALDQIGNAVDAERVLQLWAVACQSAWSHPPVWLHGDVAIGNILQADGRLAGVIDFGNCGVGDPACDLTIAWTLFEGAARDQFRDVIGLDNATWERARGWALWKACLDCAAMKPGAPALVKRLCAAS